MRLTPTWRLLVGTGLAAVSSMAAGQSESAIAECSRIAGASERILCLEEAIRSLSDEDRPAPVEVAPAPAAEMPAPPPAAETPPAVVTPDVDDELIVSQEASQGAPAPTEDVRAPAAAAAPPPAAIDVTQAPANEPAAGELGAEQVAARSGNRESTERFQATVVAFDFVRRDKLRVTLDNGQVWRQTDADRPNHYRSLRHMESFEVEMWKTGLGGYRMLIKPTNRMVRVQRLK